jgi:hypothetical protein
MISTVVATVSSLAAVDGRDERRLLTLLSDMSTTKKATTLEA